MKERLEAIREQAIAKIKDAKDISVLNDVRVEILGKKGQLTEVLKGMKDVAPEDRPKVGQLVNDTRKRIEEELENVKKDLEAKAREAKLKAEVIDSVLQDRYGIGFPAGWRSRNRVRWRIKWPEWE